MAAARLPLKRRALARSASANTDSRGCLDLPARHSRAITGRAATARNSVSNHGQARGERWQRRLDGLPHDTEVDVEIAVGHSIAHASHALPRHIPMKRDERRMVVGQFGRCLTEDNDIQNHRLLGSPVSQKAGLVQTFDVGAGEIYGLEHVLKIVIDSTLLHTGCACESTSARIFNGRSPGVSRSTRTPSKLSSSIYNPPRSNKVAPGKGSTIRSRSLPSRSAPRKAEPNTRRFTVLNLRAARCMAMRFASSAIDGRMVTYWLRAVPSGVNAWAMLAAGVMAGQALRALLAPAAHAALDGYQL